MTAMTANIVAANSAIESPIVDKIRAGRRAALASLNTRHAQGSNVVSFFQDQHTPRVAVPEFHTVRKTMPVLVLTERVAA